MKTRSHARIILSAAALAAAAGIAHADVASGGRRITDAASASFLSDNPGSGVFRSQSGRITSVFGAAFSTGASAADSSMWFVTRYADLFGVSPVNLVPENRFGDRSPTVGLGYNPATGTFKHTLVYYTQYQDGVPVYNADLRVLVRNEPGSPTVLVKSAVRDLHGFTVPADAARRLIDQKTMQQAARDLSPVLSNFSAPELVVWAGVDDMVVEPALALVFTADNAASGTPGLDRRRIIVDAFTGAVLHQESLVHQLDISGTVSGVATADYAADVCRDESGTPMPYARVTAGAETVYADAAGAFTLAADGTVTATSDVRGRYFRVFDNGGANDILSQTVSPPGPASFLHNADNSSEFIRAQVNTYIAANQVRDYTLSYNPAYPVIAGQTEFPVNVNLNSTCNAFYDGESINFYRSGGGCPNTGFGTVVHHEYGHHLVSSAGSGQGGYGEGMGDVMGMLITDESVLARGFRSNCSTGLRDADNNCQYSASACSSCGSEAHDCGQLIAGAVWSVRTLMAASNPADYRQIMSSLAIDSMLLHQGTIIDSTITIDYLALDDDDDDIYNGSPHYAPIYNGFAAHNLVGAPLNPLSAIGFRFEGLTRPTTFNPAGGVAFRFEVVGLSGTPLPGSGEVLYSVDGGAVTPAVTSELAANVYQVTLPAIPCGAVVSFYLSADSTAGVQVTSPIDAPATFRTAISAVAITTPYSDEVESAAGWQTTIAGDNAVSGRWSFGDPLGTGAQPEDDHTPGSGSNCFFTGQGTAGGGLGQADVDGGTTTLTSPAFAVSQYTAPRISYWRWYSNDQGAAPNADVFVVQVSNDGGASWTEVETVGPTGAGTSGGWIRHEFLVSDLLTPTDQMKLRFIASDLDAGSLVEAAVDDVAVSAVDCSSCPADFNGVNGVDSQDFFDFISAFFEGNADFNHSGATDSQDFFDFVSAFFTPC